MSDTFNPEKVRRYRTWLGSTYRGCSVNEEVVESRDYDQLLALYRAAVPLPDACVGEPCWFNQETGYRELCSKHEELARSSQSVVK